MKKTLNLYENIQDNKKIYINNSLINFKIYLRNELLKYNIKTFINTDRDYINVIFIKNENNIKLSLRKCYNIICFNSYYQLEEIKDYVKTYLTDNEKVAEVLYCLLRINYIKNNL